MALVVDACPVSPAEAQPAKRPILSGATCTVYGLSRSDEPGVRYVGQTTCTLAARLGGHVKAAVSGRRGRRSAWIRKAIREGAVIEILPLQFGARWNIDEERWIAAFRGAGVPILNVADGGTDSRHSVSRSARARLSQATKKQWSDAEYRAKVVANQRAYWTPERRLAQAERMRGRAASAAQREATRARNIKRYSDPEKLAKQRAQIKEIAASPKRIANLRAAYADPDLRRRISDRMKAVWAARKGVLAC